MNRRTSAILILLIALAPYVHGDIRLASLNCYFLFSPANHERTVIERPDLAEDVYRQKVSNLGSLIGARGLDFVGLEEIGSQIETGDLATNLQQGDSGWRACFVQGNDTYTGEDVAALIHVGPGWRLRGAYRARELARLSKHLVVECQIGGENWRFLVVHLIRPIGSSGIAKHAEQLAAIAAWVEAQRGVRIGVVGDFNDDRRELIPLSEANPYEQATHLTGRAFDHIFANARVRETFILRPPYGKRPNDLQRTLWTDHYLLGATIAENEGR